ncbi:hypothetical protein LCGC14_2635360 [marine sediment metagenome]|uniref:Uncharacterized protein n=1 Tax=marine sediment metagenome TaxID=412755 RepID=A0A0F8ZYX8_9ZZZZ
MSVTFKTTMECREHPEYTGKRKITRINMSSVPVCWGCVEVYNTQRTAYYEDDEASVKITEVQHNG